MFPSEVAAVEFVQLYPLWYLYTSVKLLYSLAQFVTNDGGMMNIIALYCSREAFVLAAVLHEGSMTSCFSSRSYMLCAHDRMNASVVMVLPSL